MMTNRPTLSETLLAHTMRRALDRAFRAASAVEAAHPGITIEVLSPSADELDAAHPDEPPTFNCLVEGDSQGEGQFFRLYPVMSLHAMRRHMEAAAVKVIESQSVPA